MARAALTLLLPLLAGLSACVVVPAGYHRGAPPPPPPRTYVEPDYPAPSAGWQWEVHPSYGWGWRHPRRGWHRGWDRDRR